MLRVLSHIAPSQRHKISLSLFWPDENARTLTVSLFKPATRLRQPRRVRPLDLCAIRPQGSLQKRLAITTLGWYLLGLALEAAEKGEALGVGLEESSDRGSESHPVRSWGIYKLYRVFTYGSGCDKGRIEYMQNMSRKLLPQPRSSADSLLLVSWERGFGRLSLDAWVWNSPHVARKMLRTNRSRRALLLARPRGYCTVPRWMTGADSCRKALMF